MLHVTTYCFIATPPASPPPSPPPPPSPRISKPPAQAAPPLANLRASPGRMSCTPDSRATSSSWTLLSPEPAPIAPLPEAGTLLEGLVAPSGVGAVVDDAAAARASAAARATRCDGTMDAIAKDAKPAKRFVSRDWSSVVDADAAVRGGVSDLTGQKTKKKHQCQ